MNTRLTAQERRDEVIAAATIEFAQGGFAGTSTASIARRAGVSQPYLFQLFATKKDLFLATVRDCFERVVLRFEDAATAAKASGAGQSDVLLQMGEAYIRMLLADRDGLRLQLHAYAACADPEIRAVVSDTYFALWRRVARISGSDPTALWAWFGEGMLINVVASLGDAHTLEEFYANLRGGVATED